jgi:glycosyltransferase involved in cell wall biosynthesis
LAQLERDLQLREQMGRRAREAVGGYDWQSVVSAYVELYEELDCGRRPVPAAPA